MREHIPEGRKSLSQRIGRHAIVVGVSAAVLLSGCGEFDNLSDQRTIREYDITMRATRLAQNNMPEKARKVLFRGVEQGVIDDSCMVDGSAIFCSSAFQQKSKSVKDVNVGWSNITAVALFNASNYCASSGDIHTKSSSLSRNNHINIYYVTDSVRKNINIKGTDSVWNAVGTPQRMKQTCKELLNG